MMKEFDGYLFDADGTLFDTTEMIVRCFENTAKCHGLPIPSRHAIISHVGMTLKAQMQVYFGILTDEEFARYRHTHMEYQLKIYKSYLKLCPGVFEAVHNLKAKGKKMAVVTSRMMQTLSIYLSDMGIIDCFDALVTPESTGRHKPDPEPALHALSMISVQPENALFVGDAVFDMECGKRAGCSTAYVKWSNTPVSENTFPPDYIISDMQEICVQ